MSRGSTETDTVTDIDIDTVTVTDTDTNKDTAGSQLLSKTFDIFLETTCITYTYRWQC